MDFLRWIAIWICVPIYKTIPKMYSIFYFLANARFLSEGVIDELSKNLYVLISVVMLFAFSATLLSAIVNPDILSDKSKGFWAVFKRAVIGIVLIVALPFMFDIAYDFQASILKNSVVEKLILGISYSDDDNTIGGKGGQVIAGTLIKSVLRPYDVGDDGETDNDEVGVEVEGLGDAYSEMIASDITRIDDVAPHINVAPADDESVKYAFDFDGLIAIIAGGVAVYILLLFAIDMAVRMFNLAFLELTAPISIMAYIGLGNKHLTSWLKEVGHVYLDVFVRIASMGFYLFLVSNLTTFFESPTLWGLSENSDVQSISGFGWRFLLQVIIIVGLLIFVNRIPNLINKAFGTNLSGKREGLRGRLQPTIDAVNGLRNGVNSIRTGAGRVAGATAAVGANVVGRSIGAINRARLNDPNNEHQARQVLAGLGGAFAGMLTSAGAARRGWQTGNLTALGNEIARERNTHPLGSTLGGRLADYATTSFGMGTALDRANDRIARQNRFYLEDEHGNRTYYTRDQLNNLTDQYNRVQTETQGALNSVSAELDRNDSVFLQEQRRRGNRVQIQDNQGNNIDLDFDQFRFEFDDNHGHHIVNDYRATNFEEITETLRALRESGPQADNYYERAVVDDQGNPVLDANGNVQMVSCNPRDAGATLNLDAFHEAQEQYQASINAFEDQIRERRQVASEYLVANADDWTDFNRAHDNTNALDTQHHIDAANQYINTDGFAPGVQGEIDSFDTLQNANDQATTENNNITRSIQRTQAQRDAEYQTDDYRRRQRNNQAEDARTSDSNTIHTTDQDANNNY